MGAAAPIALAAAGTGLSAAGSINQGNTAAANYRTQGTSALFGGYLDSEQAKLAADAGELKAAQTNRFLIDQANQQMGNLRAIQAVNGDDMTSPSDWAVQNRAETVSDQYRNITVGNIEMQSEADRRAALLYQMSGMNSYNIAMSNAGKAQTQGWLGAGGYVLKGLSGLRFG